MKFSICIPTLNEEKYLPILLEALTQQSHKDFEVIVVDANSKDKTLEKAESFTNKIDIRTYLSPQKGQSFQRNYAASKATSENLVFFDADVKPAVNFLETLANLVKDNKVDSVTAWNIPLSNKPEDHVVYGLFNVLYLDILRKWTHGSVGTFIFAKKKAFDQVGGFDTKISVGEDMQLTKKLDKAGFKTKVLRSPGIHFSVRRLEEEGRLNFYKKMIKGEFYLVLSRRDFKAIQGKTEYKFGEHK